MVKFAQLVIGPAGCGKSTYCKVFQTHCENTKKVCKVVNLDPAAEEFQYTCAVDVREMISVEDVMEETGLGPNGSLIYAMEYLIDNFDWFEEKLESFIDDDYLLFDCPGQIELFTHCNAMRGFINQLQQLDFRICAVYCLDVSFCSDAPRFIAGTLTALSSMIQLELPHTNVLTKCDLIDDQEEIDSILASEPYQLMANCRVQMPEKYRKLNNAVCALLEDYNMVSFVPLNADDEDSIAIVARTIDGTIQYGEDLEPDAEYDLNNEDNT